MPSEKFFSESEIAALIRRAAELQEENASSGYVPGVSTNELTKMAAEAGIEAKFVESAIAEQMSSVSATPRKPSAEVERVYPVDIDPADYDVITDAIKVMPLTQHKGAVSGGVTQIGRTVQGQAKGGWDNPHFKLTSRGGRTKLNVRSDRSIAMALSILWIIPLALAPAIGIEAGVPIAGMMAAFFSILGAFWTYNIVSAKAAEVTEDTAKKLEGAILQYGDSVRANLAKPVTVTSEEAEVNNSAIT